jgi:hypothetical protein
MRIVRFALAGTLALLLPFALPAAAQRGLPGVVSSAEALTCDWTREVAPDRVRSPVQMDVHAAYRIFALKSDGTIGYRVRGEFPFAAFLSYTVYDGTRVYDALIDHDFVPDTGSTNPFGTNALIHAADRGYTVTVLPDGAVRDASMPNPILMPAPRRPSNVATVVLVQRVYLPEPGQDRYGGVDAPAIEPFLVSDPATPAACPGDDDLRDIADEFGNVGRHFSQSPLPRDGKIEFHRPPVSDVPFADGDGFQDKHDCTGYLMATVYPDRLAVIHLPTVPAFFDNTDIGPTTRFVPPAGVRYLSLGSYGASVMGVLENENVAGPELRRLPDGGAAFVAIPVGLSSPDATAVIHKADQLGYNVMPLADYGPLIADEEDSPQINPFLIYRNKVASEGFPGDIKYVACFQGTSFSHAPRKYAASPDNMGQYAPTGVECAVADFVAGSCGQDLSDARR